MSRIRCDSLCQGVGRRKRRKTDLKKIDGRGLQEHQKENKTITEKMDEDKKERGKDSWTLPKA